MATLKKGSKGKYVKTLQTNLEKLKYYFGKIDGDFGSGTEQAVKNFQKDYNLLIDGIVGVKTNQLIESYVSHIATNNINLPILKYHLNEDEYVKKIFPKKAICLHHTSGNASAINVVAGWEHDRNKSGNVLRIGTAYIVSREYNKYNQNLVDGQIIEAFPPEYMAWHLGIGNNHLENISIGIEICSFGGLVYKNNNFLTYVGSTIPKDEVYEHHSIFRGYKYFQKYTSKQIDSVYKLIVELSKRFNIKIDLGVVDDNWFDYNPIKNDFEGIFTHTNVRKDKHDCFPQPELIQMLNSL